jgi:hypothetical protein
MELSDAIFVCIADNKRYWVKNSRIIKIVFTLVKSKIKKESLVVKPNMIRFLTLKLVNNDQTLVVKIGNIITLYNNQTRLFTQIFRIIITGLTAALF